MSMTIPTIPNLPAGYVATLADMQNLSAAATFLLTKPATKAVDGTGGLAIATTTTVVTYSATAFDTDGMWTVSQSGRLTVQTPGMYKLRYGVNVGTTAGTVYTAFVTSVSGSNNPVGAGIESLQYWTSYTDDSAGTIAAWCRASGVWPFFLYAGDYLRVKITAAAAGSSTGTTGPGGITGVGSYFSLELVSI